AALDDATQGFRSFSHAFQETYEWQEQHSGASDDEFDSSEAPLAVRGTAWAEGMAWAETHAPL
ncbi:MAG: hypothetical protein MUC88_22255, partial [Planctomycetes bacterium]|nr:hypothetical protein [Planctomycetota bacterium]